MNQRKAVTEIYRQGALLVFSMANTKIPNSLWNVFFPRSKMKWEWDENGDDRVGQLWRLRAELTSRRDVVYSKWFKGRATFFSPEAFVCGLVIAQTASVSTRNQLSLPARELLDILDMDSPLSPRELRRLADLQGRANEARYTRALKELWNQFFIVGCGEIEDGSFPSLAIGSTRLIYEDLWNQSRQLSKSTAWERLESTLGASSPLIKQMHRLFKKAELEATVASL